MTSLEDYQFLDSFKRKHIKLTLKTATFVGVVQRININKTVILEDVVEVKNGRKFPGVKLFFGHEILNVEFPNATKQDPGDADDHRLEGHLTVAEFQPYRKSIILDDDDEDEQYVNFVVIDEFHEKFGPAVMHIRKQQVIGIGADGVGAFQHERLCWLQIATKNKVYLFDILLLGARAFKNGLSMILENNHILKVTHDCRSIAGCLMAQFGVNLTNVFDTQVADILYFYTETGGFLPDRVGTLQQVVSLHLKMPTCHLSSLKIKSQLTSEDREVWYVRPCPVSLLKVMALSVIHLQPLRLVLLDALMSDYTGLVDSYLTSSRDEPVHMQHIGKSSGLELPKELRELELMRRERQEWAVGRYPVSEEGLLERANPRPEAQSQHSAPPGLLATGETAAQTRPAAMMTEDTGDVSLKGRLVPGAVPLAPAPGPRKELFGETPLSAPGGPGLMEIVMDTMGRGRPPGRGSAPTLLASFPGIGRGLSLQIPADAPREGPGGGSPRSPAVGVGKTEPEPPLSKPLSTMGGVAQQAACPAGRGVFQRAPSLASPLSLSFSSFRKGN